MEKEVKLLEVVDGETLMDMQFPKSRFCIQSLLPKGVSILGGAPKTGKSWMVLDWCVRIAKGESVWNLPTEKGTVLYLCLEDSLARIQNRLNCITDEVPSNLYVATKSESIETGLIQQIQNFIITHTDTTLIVIDTFLIGNLLDLEMQNNTKRKWMPHHSKKEIEKLIAQGQKITNEDYDDDYDEYHGFGMFM